ncbi:MAG: Protein PafC [Planctomycetes bacterium]|nr:Protein PafC [Planctomycetota bacterium]
MTRDPYEGLRHALALIPMIQAHPGLTLEELAARTGLSENVITDEVARLVLMCGVPPYAPNNYVSIWVERGRVYVRFAEQFERPVRLVLHEALALLLALKPLAAGDHPFSEAVRGLRKKVLHALGPEAQRQLDRAERTLRGPAAREVRRTGNLREALRRCRELRIVYWSAHRAALTERVIRPYAMAEHDGEWYVIAWDSERKDVVSFRVDRIREADLLDTEYEIPLDFDVRRWNRDRDFAPAPGKVAARIRFTGDAVRWVREELPGKDVLQQGDGSVVASVRVGTEAWFLSWLFQFGPDAEVLEPADLRERVAACCRRMLEFHEQPLPKSRT